MLVKATPYPKIHEIGVGGSIFAVEFQNVGSIALASATLKVRYHPKGEWWASALSGDWLIGTEGAAIATLAPGAKGVSILDTKGIFALQFTLTCAGDWNTSYPNDQTYLNIYGTFS